MKEPAGSGMSPSAQALESRIKKNIAILYFSRVTVNLIFFGPVIVLFFMDLGLSIAEIMLLETFFSAVIVLFEVPSGFFADRAGRKLSLMLGLLAFLAGCLILSVGSSFSTFLAAEFFCAVGVSFLSGCELAILYDTLAVLGDEGDFQRIQGRANMIGLLTMAACSLLGGYLGAMNLRWPLYATVFGLAAGFPVLLLLTEPPRKKGGHRKGELYYLYKIGRFALYKNKEVRMLIWLGALTVGMSTVGFWLYQPYMKEAGIPIIWFGIVFAGFNVFAAISSALASKVSAKMGKILSLLSIPLALGLSNILMGFVIHPAGVLLILAQQFSRGFGNPVITDYMNRQVWADKRATVDSLRSLFGRVIFMVVAPLTGLLVDKTSLSWGLEATGLFTIVCGVLLVLKMRQDDVV